MVEWTQDLLDKIQYLVTIDKMPDDLLEMYKKLPKKKDGTLNMCVQNKPCYTFIELLNTRTDFYEVLTKVFGIVLDAPIRSPIPIKPQTPIEEKKTVTTKLNNSDDELPSIDKLKAKAVVKELRKLLKSALTIIEILDDL